MFAYLFLTERGNSTAFDTSVVKFKRGSKSAEAIISSKSSTVDEEKGSSTRDASINNVSDENPDAQARENREEVEEALKREETARKRKHISEKRLEDEKVCTHSHFGCLKYSSSFLRWTPSTVS